MIDPDVLMTSVSTVIAQWMPKVLGALAVLGIGLVAARWARRLSQGALARSSVDPMLAPFVAGIVYVGVVALVVVAAVSTLGVATGSFIAVLGAAGLAIALAFQDTFSNFAAGVMLLSFRPFEIENYVEIGGQAGTVRAVGIFSCVLATPDNVEIRIPNAQVFGQTIRNYSANDTRRIDLVIGVGYDDDLGVAVRTCQDVLASDSRVLEDPEAVVAVHELGDSSVNLVVRPWVRASDYWPTRWDLIRALKENLEAAGCSIPYPQRDVHLHQTS
ncbi:MAG: mechanosensitive ion channel [Gemmatimonadota bacterium]|nr:mechanosensitive ion channel [Gemmatimonadota bacterium]